MTYLSSDLVVAKKPHRCSGCLHEISIGQTYQRDVYSDGGPYTWKTCACCMAFIEKYDKQAGKALKFWQEHDDGICVGEMREIDGFKEFSGSFWRQLRKKGQQQMFDDDYKTRGMGPEDYIEILHNRLDSIAMDVRKHSIHAFSARLIAQLEAMGDGGPGEDSILFEWEARCRALDDCIDLIKRFRDENTTRVETST